MLQKAQALDDITASLSGIMTGLDTTIMFTTAGTLDSLDSEAEDGAGHLSFAGQREDILRLAQVLVQDVQRLLVSSSGSRVQLTEAAAVAHENMAQLVERIKAGAVSLGSQNQETQVSKLYCVLCCHISNPSLARCCSSTPPGTCAPPCTGSCPRPGPPTVTTWTTPPTTRWRTTPRASS